MSSYIKYLPALFQEGADTSNTDFLKNFLLAFEHLLSKRQVIELENDSDLAQQLAVGEILANIDRYFDPITAPAGEVNPRRVSTIGESEADFLPWLASWVALTLRNDWTIEEKSRFIQEIIPLYRFRGTKQGLKRILKIYTNLSEQESIKIHEFPNIPNYFQVEIDLSGLEDLNQALDDVNTKERIARAIIDQEKPAHTYYALRVRTPDDVILIL
jgi:P2-related tail formation protein